MFLVIAFVYLEYKQISSSKLDQSCRQYPVNRLTQNYVPSLGQNHMKLYALFRISRKKNLTLSSSTSLYRPYKGVHPLRLELKYFSSPKRDKEMN